jgi:aryl-alcohol dehydrogenase-like predicted oxidoreductase
MTEAREYASSKKCLGFVGDQMRWNAALYSSRRGPIVMNRAMYRFMEESSMAAFAWASQANGYFTKLARTGGVPDAALAKSPYHTEENLKLYELLRDISERHDMSITGVVLQYLLCQRLPTIPLVGNNTLEQLEDSLRGAEENLPPEVLRAIEEAVGMDAGGGAES